MYIQGSLVLPYKNDTELLLSSYAVLTLVQTLTCFREEFECFIHVAALG